MWHRTLVTTATRSPPRQLITSATRRSLTSTSCTSSSSSTTTPSARVDQRWPGWQPVIGLELHVQLKGNVKLLSPARSTYDAPPNSCVAPFDAALPGTLPTLGAEPVRLALLACLALKSSIHPASTFDRKHYFYPDLPSGFQVTQKYEPLAKGGSVRVRRDGQESTQTFEVRIDQVQLEQDTAKSSHDPDTGSTLVDLNRAGAALIEIVTEPDMRSPEDAAAFVRHLQSILRHIGASDANMDRGELRCDVNVSVQRTGRNAQRGTRCEVKNLNGVRFLMAAIESEVDRQIIELEAQRPIAQATRGFNAITSQTYHLRSKEDAPDYRYMPDPELGAVIVSEDQLNELRNSLPELPDDALDRLQTQHGLSSRDASILVALGERMDDDASTNGQHSSAGLGVRFLEDVARGRDARIAANWVIHELLGQLAKVDRTLASSPISPPDLGSLIDAVVDGRLTGTRAKVILREHLQSTPSPTSFASRISSATAAPTTSESLAPLLQQVITDLPEEAGKVRNGQTKVLMRLVGEVMKRSGGKADAKAVADQLRALLGVK